MTCSSQPSDSLFNLLGQVEEDDGLALLVEPLLELGESKQRRLHRPPELPSVVCVGGGDGVTHWGRDEELGALLNVARGRVQRRRLPAAHFCKQWVGDWV